MPDYVVSVRLEAIFGGVVVIVKSAVVPLNSKEIITAGPSGMKQPITTQLLRERVRADESGAAPGRD